MAADYDINLEHEYHNLGNDYYKLGEFDKSIEHYNKAIELKPDLLETYFNRGLAYTRKQLYDKAIEDLNKVIDLNQNLAEAYYTRGLVYEYKAEYDRAITDYDKALEIDPKYSKAESQRDVAKSKKASGVAPAPSAGGAPSAQTAQGGEGDGLTKFDVLKKPNMNFDDVAGLEKTKELIKDSIVYPLTDIELAKKYGKKSGGGVLFYGPPGTGKTFIGKATAGECEAAFINVKISDIVDMYAGNTEKNMHNAFDTGRQHKPCILFFDEVDGMGGKREGQQQSFERRAINQFLTEMDGVEYDNEGLLVIGSTNAPWDVDSALRRAGRFSKMIYFPEPDTATRKELLRLHLKDMPFDPKISIDRLARMTGGFSGADMKELVDSAAAVPWKEALKTKKERLITFNDFKKVTAGDRAIMSSLPAWYSSVKRYLIEDEEEEDGKGGKSFSAKIFRDIFDFSPAQATGGGDSTTTVKHKKEQEQLLGEEERRLFNDLIKDIKKHTDPMYKMVRKAKMMFARYVR